MRERSKNGKLRERARAANKQWYDTGEPCKNNHIAPRSVATGKCRECTRATSRKFFSKQQPGPNAGQIQRAKKAREEAIANGEIMYKSGKDCPNGHKNPWRYIIAYNCVECNSERQAKINQAKREERERLGIKPKKRGRPKTIKAAPKPKQEPKVVITKEDRDKESFAEIVRRTYARNARW